MILNPLLNRGLVGEPRIPTVYLRLPPSGVIAEGGTMEVTTVPCWVSEEEDHGLAVRQPSFPNLVNLVRDRARFVEDVPARRICRVLAGERLAVLFLRGLRSTVPIGWIALGVHLPGVALEPMPEDAELRPVLDRCPCLRLKLVEGVGRDGAVTSGPSHHDPVHQPSYQRALSDAVA